MRPRIRRTIFCTNLRLIVVGAVFAIAFGSMCYGAFSDPSSRIIPIAVPALAIAGACVLFMGLAFLVFPAINPAVRSLRRYGPTRAIAAEIDRELPNAQVLYRRMYLTENWLAFLGWFTVYAVPLEHLVIAFRRNTPDERSQLVLGDIYGVETILDLDGFEITRILAALQKASPTTTFQVDDALYGKWKNGILRPVPPRPGFPVCTKS